MTQLFQQRNRDLFFFRRESLHRRLNYLRMSGENIVEELSALSGYFRISDPAVIGTGYPFQVPLGFKLIDRVSNSAAGYKNLSADLLQREFSFVIKQLENGKFRFGQ